MAFDTANALIRMPGLYRLWDLQFVIAVGADYEICYVETTADGTALFAVHKRLRQPDGGGHDR